MFMVSDGKGGKLLNWQTATIMPILFSVSSAIGIDPIKIMIPAAISASCAFMLPVATAPNAIIYGSEKVLIKHMIKQVIKLNLIGALVVAVIATWWL